MSTQFLRVRTLGRLPRAVRVALYATVLAGAGIVAALTSGSTPFPSVQAKPTSAATIQSVALTIKATPTVQAVQPSARGTLVICGGGKLSPSIRQEFCKLAGGPRARIVVIPTAATAAGDADYLDHVLKD